MLDTPNQNCKTTVPITGSTLRKSADGDGTEKDVLSGMASHTTIGLTGEQMAETAFTMVVMVT